MPALTVLIGLMLILLGLGGYGYAHANGGTSPTPLIPSAIGALILLCGIISIFRENLRKHLMHGALLLALIGIIGGCMGLPGLVRWLSGDVTQTILQKVAMSMQIVMGVLCLVFIIFGVKSFIAARRSRIGNA